MFGQYSTGSQMKAIDPDAAVSQQKSPDVTGRQKYQVHDVWPVFYDSQMKAIDSDTAVSQQKSPDVTGRQKYHIQSSWQYSFAENERH
jgi:hypothetical protein